MFSLNCYIAIILVNSICQYQFSQPHLLKSFLKCIKDCPKCGYISRICFFFGVNTKLLLSNGKGIMLLTPFILYIVCKGYNPVNVPLEGLVHFDNFLYMHVGWCNVLSLK